jgi:hypothetical protein
MDATSMNDTKRLFDDPPAMFADPQQVLNVPQLTLDEKLFVLRRWKRTLERQRGSKASPMVGARPDRRARLAAVVDAIDRLSRSA